MFIKYHSLVETLYPLYCTEFAWFLSLWNHFSATERALISAEVDIRAITEEN